jgi:hypothetical protein
MAMRGLVVMMPSVSMSDAAVPPEDAFGGVAVDDTHSETRRAPADRSRGDKRAFALVRSHQSPPGPVRASRTDRRSDRSRP